MHSTSLCSGGLSCAGGSRGANLSATSKSSRDFVHLLRVAAFVITCSPFSGSVTCLSLALGTGAAAVGVASAQQSTAAIDAKSNAESERG